MDYSSCKEKFIETWGELGIQWGINKTMAQIHALLLLAPHPMKTEHIIQKLSISQGNANMNIRALLDWGLVYKSHIEGERCEYFIAEKNLNIIFKKILEHRKKKELDPLLEHLQEIQKCACKCEESAELVKMVTEINEYAHKANRLLELMIQTDSHWLFNSLMKVIK